ncbi:hypothetical protein [Metabacillus herbersteinensis]|uniref:hypothetical protein n=1 Tax=Metabacillus herbersteinensis TaxID=283816 RepID=UPI00366ED7D8
MLFQYYRSHNVARKFFSWVFYSGKVQAYFITWEIKGEIPSSEEATTIIKIHGRHFDGGKLVKKSTPLKVK